MVMMSPAEPPLEETLGVVSFVRLSVADEPESETADRSGVPGADGAVESTVSGSAVPAVDWLPAGSVTFAVTDQLPAESAGRSHDVAEPTTYEHVFVVEPFVAVMVAVSPVDPPATENAGVVSEVTSSAEEVPESDAGARSGAAGAAGGVVSSVTVGPAAAAPGPTVPVDDVTDPDESVGVTVPSLHPDTVTVNVADVPTDGLGVKTQPVAFPAFEKSAALSVEASIVPEKSRE